VPDAARDTESETMDFELYERNIERPARAFLARHPGIDFIVLTKGIPIRLRDAGQGNGVGFYSLDGHLAALDYDKIPGANRVDIHDPSTIGRYISISTTGISTVKPGATGFGIAPSRSLIPI